MKRSILSDAERNRITEAVIAAERSTSGEIVPLVVRASDDYRGARWRLAVSFTLLAMGILVLAWPVITAIELLLISVPLLGVGHLLAVWPPLLRLAVSKAEIETEVRQKARESFVDLNVHETRDRIGVLILVSLLERRIEVLADIGIHARAPEGYWDEIVADLVKRIRQRELASGLADAIQRIGALLAQSFPAQAGDRNELPDAVLVED